MLQFLGGGICVGKKRAAIYARYSSDNQQELSIEGQLDQMLEFCQKHGYEVVKQYADRGISAFLIEKRHDFLKLIEDAMEAKFDYVIVWSYDRFARSRLDARRYKELLKEYGIKVISVTEPSIDGPEGIIVEGMTETIAEYFVAKLARDSMRGMITKAKRGALVGGYAPFGYKKVKVGDDWKLIPDEKEAKAVQKIFQMRAEGVTYSEIARYLNNLGFKSRRGENFTNASVEWMLRNPKYKGEYVFNNRKKKGKFNPFNEVIRVQIPEIAIVPPELWQKVQKISGIRKEPRIRYLLRGLMRCGDCGYPLTGSSYGGKANKGGYYTCLNCKRKHNKTHKLGRDKIEGKIMNLISLRLRNLDIEQLTAEMNSSIKRKIDKGRTETLRSKLKEVERSIDNITKAIETGVYSQTLLNRLSELEREHENLATELTKARMQALKFKEVKPKEVAMLMENFKSAFSNYETRYSVVHELVDYVIIDWRKREAKVVSAVGKAVLPL